MIGLMPRPCVRSTCTCSYRSRVRRASAEPAARCCAAVAAACSRSAAGPSPADGSCSGSGSFRQSRCRATAFSTCSHRLWYKVLVGRRRPTSTTCFFDLSGDQGLLGQVQGRTADDAAYWLAQAAPAWRDAVRVVAIDMCSIYAAAVRRMLPGAQIAVDLFHVVHLAVKMTGDVRRRVVRGKYGRRGRSGDPEYGIKNLLVRNLEHLSPARFAKVTGILQVDAAGQEIAAAWIGKEKLRHALNLRARVTGSVPCERHVRDRLFAFYDWCACNDDIPELVSLARTISRWEDQIVCAVLTGVTNATSESLNRLAKLEARLAYGFRNPANQRRRVRIACSRGNRRRSRIATSNGTRSVTGPKPDPG